MDARAYRLSWPNGTRFCELDHPELLAINEEFLQREGLPPKCPRLGHDWAYLLTDVDS